MFLRLLSLAGTEDFARRIASVTRSGDCILLTGPLGAGKTTFARAFLRAVSGDPGLEVPSPSFTLVQTYETPLGAVHHYDLWRLDGPAALTELGWDEAREEITLVEWPERLGELTPEDALRLTFTFEADDARTLSIDGWSGRVPVP